MRLKDYIRGKRQKGEEVDSRQSTVDRKKQKPWTMDHGLWTILCACALVFSSSLCVAQSEVNLSPGNVEHLPQPVQRRIVPGELIIKFKPEANINLKISDEGAITTGCESIDLLNNKFNITKMEKVFKSAEETEEVSRIYKLSFPKEIDLLEMLREYRKDPTIEYAEPNYIYGRRRSEKKDDIRYT